MNNKGIIPMDGAIKEFDLHLKSHPRTILSAKFGDGKSFFLAAAEKKLKKRYIFLKLYPVNYQVAENKDIFEYIKRDLLFQLYGHGMLPASYDIPDSIAAYFFLQNNWKDFADETFKDLSYFDVSNTLKAVHGAAKFLKTMKKKYDEFKSNGGESNAAVNRFMADFDGQGIYESDAITSILCDIIKQWKKENHNKKICLVFEDMDRIDPAHIFRILNVISAHMDYCYKYGVSPKRSLAGNKFGVDNIVVCLDYENLKGIYSHFYGQKASFEGYINKFCDRGIFSYSLKEQALQFYKNELMQVTGMDANTIDSIADQFDLGSYTLRQFYHAIEDVGKQISLPGNFKDIVPHRGLFVMSAVLRRLGFLDEEIISVLSKAFRAQPSSIGIYAGTCMMLRRNIGNAGYEFSLGEKDSGYYVVYIINDFHHDGVAFIRRQVTLNKVDIINPEDEFKYILGFVGK